MSSDYPTPQNAAEQQAAKDALTSNLSGTAQAEQARAQSDARRLEQQHSLGKQG